MRITCLTPVHIGTGNEIPDFEFVFDDDAQQLTRVSLNKLVTQVAQFQNLDEQDDLVSNLRTYQRQNRMSEFAEYHLAGEGRTFLAECERKRADRDIPVDVRETMKFGINHRPIIPGSSLKGALLSGWYFGELWEKLGNERCRGLLDIENNRFSNDLSRLTPRQRRDAKSPLELYLFEIANGKNPEWNFSKRARTQGRLSDCLKISDVHFPPSLSIRPARRVADSSDDGIPTWVECISATTSGEFSLALRPSSEGAYGHNELSRRATLFAEAILVAEMQFFQFTDLETPAVYDGGVVAREIERCKTNPASGCVARLGWGSGKLATSMVLLNSSADLTLQANVNPVKKRPMTRWLLNGGEPLGWCKIEFGTADE